MKDATISTLSTEVERMAGGLKTLKSRLLEIQQYLELVLEGKLPVNHDIIYSLQVSFLFKGSFWKECQDFFPEGSHWQPCEAESSVPLILLFPTRCISYCSEIGHMSSLQEIKYIASDVHPKQAREK